MTTEIQECNGILRDLINYFQTTPKIRDSKILAKK